MIKKEESIELFYEISHHTSDVSDNEPTISKPETLKIHLMTEVILDNIINLSFHNKTTTLSSLELTYGQKLELCCDLRLANIAHHHILCTDVAESLKRLNKLRNDIACDLNKKILLEDIEDLFIGQLKEKRANLSLNDPSKLILSLYKSMIYINMLNPGQQN